MINIVHTWNFMDENDHSYELLLFIVWYFGSWLWTPRDHVIMADIFMSSWMLSWPLGCARQNMSQTCPELTKFLPKCKNIIIIITIAFMMIMGEPDQINDAVCLSNQRSCSSGIWPRSGKKDAQKGHHALCGATIFMIIIKGTPCVNDLCLEPFFKMITSCAATIVIILKRDKRHRYRCYQF